MAEVICAEPALSDLDAIADYIALDKSERLLRPELLSQLDESGS